MNYETNINRIYGRLDTAYSDILIASDVLNKEWNKGTVRMRKEDIDRAKAYLKKIKDSTKIAKEYLDKFALVAPEKK